MASHITPIIPARNRRVIEFVPGNEAKGFRTLMLSNIPVRVTGKNRYIVSDMHCAILKEKGIGYKVIESDVL